jgi:serine/threonine protein kinase
MAGVSQPFPKVVYPLAGSVFEVDPHYRVLSVVGQGLGGGLVCDAIDMRGQGGRVAIKKLAHVLDEPIACKRLLRELRLLRNLKHDNLLNLHDIMLPPALNVLLWRDVYIVTDLMDTDLLYVINNKDQDLSDDHVQYLAFQLLAGIAYIHAASVVHRDLKPSNLLVNKNCDLKICDFGLARSFPSGPGARADDDTLLTMYVTTRWYRAPELLCLKTRYNDAVDICAVGCILAEMLSRKALLPGRDFKEQLRLIIELIGTPSSDEIEFIENNTVVQYIESLERQEPKPLEQVLPGVSASALDLVRRMLCFDVTNRVTAQEALRHQYLQEYNTDGDEHRRLAREAAKQSEWFLSMDASKLPKMELQNLIFQEMIAFHPETLMLPWGAEKQPAQDAASAQGSQSGAGA